MRDQVRQIASAFATALDGEDYDAASRLLHPDCVYRFRDDIQTGPEMIIASYRESGEWAAANLDAIAYEHEVEVVSEDSAVIRFVDRSSHRGRDHVHQCEQRVTVGADGLISAIEHRDLPGEPEALAEFFEAVGLQRR